MSGSRYIVDIELNMPEGAGSSMLGKASSIADGMEKRLGKVGSAFADGFTGAVEYVGDKLATLGKIGIGAGVAAVTYGVLGLNKELEATQVSLAAVLNSQGMAAGMADGMEMASGWLKQIKKDAKDLPGEFSDLLGIVQSGAGAAFNAGLDVKGFEAIAAQGMAAAKSMSVPIDQAGRELAQLLEGRAGGHNVFGTRLGIHSEGFNEKDSAARLKILTEALAKFEPAIKTFGDTFVAQSSTLIDNAKTFLGAATGPLFVRIKDTLAEANSWFDANQDTILGWAHTVGDDLGWAFDKGKEKVLEYGPPLLGFFDRAKDKFIEIWTSAEPYLEKIGGLVKGFLNDPGAIDKLVKLVEAYAAVKVGGGIAGFAGGAVPGSGAVGAGIQAGAFGYMAGDYAGGLGAVGAGAAGGAAFGGQVGGASGAVVGGILGTVAGEFVTLDQELKAYQEAQLSNYMHLLEFDRNSHDAHGRIDTSSKGFADAVEAAAASANFLDSAFGNVATQMGIAAAKLNILTIEADSLKSRQASAAASAKQIDDAIAASNKKTEGERAAKRAELDKKKAGAAGKGGVSIGNVNITVSSNQSPGQIARDVMKEAVGMKRYRTSSPRVANYSAGR